MWSLAHKYRGNIYFGEICYDVDSLLLKVQLFWEGHKNLSNLPHGFDVY